MTVRQIVLAHSPIVGPDTWSPVAEVLAGRGWQVAVPQIADDGHEPFWEQHSAAIAAQAAEQLDVDRPGSSGPGTDVLLAGHSGAGQLLPHVARALAGTGRTVTGLVFVDAGLPTEGTSRLEQLRDETPEQAAQLEALLDARKSYPDWTDEMLTSLVPDPQRRQGLIAGIRRQPATFWTEPIPAVAGWDRTPCAALLLSGSYEATRREAQRRGWPLRDLGVGNHFWLLVDPEPVADALEELAAELTPA